MFLSSDLRESYDPFSSVAFAVDEVSTGLSHKNDKEWRGKTASVQLAHQCYQSLCCHRLIFYHQLPRKRLDNDQTLAVFL